MIFIVAENSNAKAQSRKGTTALARVSKGDVEMRGYGDDCARTKCSHAIQNNVGARTKHGGI